MARDVFHMTISQPVQEPDLGIDLLKPLSGVRVSVYSRGTTDLISIFQRSTGATEGPTPESTATGGPNPFVTGPTGDVEFWANGPDEVDVAIEDTIAPARIPPRTFGWNVTVAADGSMPTSILADDGNLSLANMGPDVQRQWIQIGQVIDWWRPAASVPIPTGFEVCDGRQIPAGSHQFPGLEGAAINLPDLRNMFILGADPTKAFAQGANQGNAATDAPGIGGTGGSNAGKNLAHGHGVPGVDHIHHVVTPDHLHGVGSLYAGDHAHYISLGTSGPYQGALSRAAGGGTTADPNHTHGVAGGSYGSGAVGIGGGTGAADRSLASWSGGSDRSLLTATNSLTWTADPGSDFRPRFIGLLKLMKVRRS